MTIYSRTNHVQEGLVLHDLKIYTTFRIYAISFTLTRCGIDYLWPHLPRFEAWQCRHLHACVAWLRWWCNYAADVVPRSTAMAFATNVSLHLLVQSKWQIGERHSVLKKILA